MKLKKDKLDDSKIIPGIDSEDSVKNNEEQLQAYISECKTHLESLREELYKILDAGLDNAAFFRTDETSPIPYTEITPSSFLKKAYTVQEYDPNGNGVENRDQPYIKAGLAFTGFCEKKGDSLSQEQQLLADAGKQAAAINTAISQLNRIEMELQQGNYENVFFFKDTISTVTNTVIDAAKDSKIIQTIPNQTNVQKILSGIVDIAKKIGDFFSNFGKSSTQQFKERFDDMKDKFKTKTTVEQTVEIEETEDLSSETQVKP